MPTLSYQLHLFGINNVFDFRLVLTSILIGIFLVWGTENLSPQQDSSLQSPVKRSCWEAQQNPLENFRFGRLVESVRLSQWESVFPHAFHFIRSLLCTLTNPTPHERLSSCNRESVPGLTLPTWLISSVPSLMRRSGPTTKFDPFVNEMQFLECNFKYVHVRFPEGLKDTVSMHHLAPSGQVLNLLVVDYSETG